MVISVTISSNFNSGDTFPIGITKVAYTVSDTSGNTESAMFTITVTMVTGKIS